jgi:hypothetical protein
MLEAVKDKWVAYYNDVPSGTGRAIAKSVIFSFSWSYFNLDRTNAFDVKQPLVNATVAAVAACIYSLTAPIFNYAFGDNRIQVHREMLKYSVNHTLTTLMYVAALSGKVSVAALPFLYILPINAILSSSNLMLSCIHGLDPRAAQAISQACAAWGLDAPPGSASIHLVI